MSVNEKMTAIADTIRSFTGKSGKLGLDDMPGAINEAVAANGYDAGYSKGYEEGEENGYINGYADGNDDGRIEGKQAEYDRFWDAYQDYGNQSVYDNCFSGAGWTEETFKPKYDVVTYSAYMLFRKTGIVDLGKAIRNSGKRVVIDTDIIQYTFNYTNLEVIDGVEFTKPITRLDSVFNNSRKLRYVQTLPISSNATQLTGFGANDALETISFSGTIPVDLNMGSSPKLNKSSIENIFGCLSVTATGKTLTLSKTAVETAFGSTTAAEWTALVATKSNWTISLV